MTHWNQLTNESSFSIFMHCFTVLASPIRQWIYTVDPKTITVYAYGLHLHSAFIQSASCTVGRGNNTVLLYVSN